MKLNLTYKLKEANCNLDTQTTKNEIMGAYRSFTPSGFCVNDKPVCYKTVIPSGLVDYALIGLFKKKPERLKLF